MASVDRRRSAPSAAGAVRKASGGGAREPEAFVLEDDGQFPNSRLPVLVYASVLPVSVGLAGEFEDRFDENGWTGSWRNGLYRVHHYHSTAHEVLGVYRGEVLVCLGGENGRRITLRAGDVAVLPAGVAHKNESQSPDFAVVGAYPRGTTADLRHGEPGERPQADRTIALLGIPGSDPVFGKHGPLRRLWRG